MKNDDKKQIIFVLVFFAVLLVIFVLTSSGLIGNHGNIIENNMKLISELFDYENTNFLEIEVDEGYTPMGVDSYLIVRKQKDGWRITKYHGGKDMNKVWSKEDLEKYDMIVFVNPRYDTKQYRNSGDKLITLSTESVDLYYYGIRSGKFFYKESIEGEELKETELYNHEISNTDINRSVEHVFYSIQINT